MDTLEKLVEAFKKFPGIGPRQARRFAYHILNESPENALQLSDLIKKLKTGIQSCDLCFRFFAPRFENQTRCSLCTDQNRDRQILMLLTQDTDISAIEQRRIYNGLYFILGKNIELSSTDPAELPRLYDLKKQFEGEIPERKEVKEIILAMNANTEGEHTAEIAKTFLKSQILASQAPSSVRITTLGRGLSTGTELEYSDAETLKSALENRR